MKLEELIKDLDPVSIIEFKNYLLEHLDLCQVFRHFFFERPIFIVFKFIPICL